MSTRIAKTTTLVLAVTCGGLCLIALLQQLGFGRGYTWLPSETSTNTDFGVATIERDQFKLPAAASFSEIEARPLFNDDRKPTPVSPVESVATDTPPTLPLNVTLSGVILTPEVHLALLRDNAKNMTLSLKEGMPMPGDEGGWTLIAVKSRSVVFQGGGDDTIEVELTTTGSGPKPPVPTDKPGPPGSKPQQMPVTQKSDTSPAPSKQAEELQRRIEERRRQMRGDAEKLKQQQ